MLRLLHFRFWIALSILAFGSDFLAGCAAPRGGLRIGADTILRDSVSEDDRRGSKRFDSLEDANEPTRLPDDSITDRIELEEPLALPESLIAAPPDSGQIRAGTWNVRLLGATKANKDNPISQLRRGGGKVWEAVLGMMAAASIHILAVQEVYLTEFMHFNERTDSILVLAQEKAGKHPLLNPPAQPMAGDAGPAGNDAGGSWGFYRGINGEPVFKLDYSWTTDKPDERKCLQRTEYCPVLYDTRQLVCKEKGNQPIGGRSGRPPRNIHFVTCSTHDGGFEFDFGCAHFAADDSINKRNIARTGPLMKARTIIGGDFNSYRFGASKTFWQKAVDAGGNIVLDPQTKVSAGKYTKISKKSNGDIGTAKDSARQVLDDIIFTSDILRFYVPGSHRPVDFGRNLFTDKNFFRVYLDGEPPEKPGVSDHLCLICDFKKKAPGEGG